MSMDFVLYTACAITIPTDLPDRPDWMDNQEFGWVYDGGTYLIRAGVDSIEDVPREASALIPDLTHATSLIVEGSRKDAADFLESVVMAVIGRCGQAVVESGTGFDKLEI